MDTATSTSTNVGSSTIWRSQTGFVEVSVWGWASQKKQVNIICQMPHMHERTRMDRIFRGLKQVPLTLEPPIIKAKRASKDWGGPDSRCPSLSTMSQKNGSKGIASTDSEKKQGNSIFRRVQQVILTQIFSHSKCTSSTTSMRIYGSPPPPFQGNTAISRHDSPPWSWNNPMRSHDMWHVPLETKAGGSVGVVGPCARIDGWGLNLSRALGDFHYKAREAWGPRRLQWSSGKGGVFRPREKILVGLFSGMCHRCLWFNYDDIFGCYDIFFLKPIFSLLATTASR